MAPASYAGKQTKCPACGAIVTIPHSNQGAAPAAATPTSTPEKKQKGPGEIVMAVCDRCKKEVPKADIVTIPGYRICRACDRALEEGVMGGFSVLTRIGSQGSPTAPPAPKTTSYGGAAVPSCWKCPKCGAVLQKQMRPLPFSCVVGRVTCSCGTSFNATEVYGGRYDLQPPSTRKEDDRFEEVFTKVLAGAVCALLGGGFVGGILCLLVDYVILGGPAIMPDARSIPAKVIGGLVALVLAYLIFRGIWRMKYR
jgi:rubredoxin